MVTIVIMVQAGKGKLYVNINGLTFRLHECIKMNMSPTCRLHTNTGHVIIAVRSHPLSIRIHIHTRLVFWFSPTPIGYGKAPAINISEISTSLKAKIDQSAFSIINSKFNVR